MAYMDDDRRRGKEYYQVNLDMGRLFWIAFLIGVILISVFIFGFFIGGDREGDQARIALTKLRKTDLFSRERVGAEKAKDELKVLDLLDKDLEGETRYIDVKSLEAAAKEDETPPQIRVEEPEPVRPAAEVKPAEEAVLRDRALKTATTATTAPKEKPVYRPVGDYYIQVASFKQESNAHQLAERLRGNRYRVEIEEAVVNETTFYRVQVGPFEKQSVAVNTMTSMKRIFDLKDPFVMKKHS
jgi:cell division septation protein DedD